MRRISILFLAILASVSVLAGGFTGRPIFVDIPGGESFVDREMMVNWDFTLGSTNSPLNEIPEHDIYFNPNFRFSFSPVPFLQVSIFVNNFNPFASGANLDFHILEEEGKYQPALFTGMQNISWQKYISTEGDAVEYDHLTYQELDADGYITNDKLYNANSFYLAASKHFGPLLLNAGLGAGRFVGFATWSKRVSIHNVISLFGGIAYTLDLKGTIITASAEQDGRDFNMAVNASFDPGPFLMTVSLGGHKLEHWFQDAGFQPKFFMGVTIIFK